ncbi:MAG: hypothetical protein LBU86_05970 [Oscillospiraceae bacterium]|jgi:hypothetical protein|nr:hypothetical protein [Oscillospiraceae bacterium]
MLIKIRSDEEKRAEERVIRDFGGSRDNPAHREAAEATARYVAEQSQKRSSRLFSAGGGIKDGTH